MSTSDSPLPAHWQFYAERARQTHHGRVDDFGYGREELLGETLAVIQSGVPFTNDCRQRLDRIPWNRAKKYRRLRLYLLGRRSAEWEAVGPGRPCGRYRLSGEKHIEDLPVSPEDAGMTCRTCGKAMITEEKAAYGSRCEDCWTVKAVGVEVADSVDQVQSMLLPSEWAVERRLAAGQTYAEAALDCGLSPDALKVRAGRWRARICRKLAVC